MKDLDRLQENLRSIAKLLRNDWDWLVCLDGDERVGKSTLALQMAIEVDPRFKRSIETGDYDRALRHVSFSFAGMMAGLDSTPKRSAHFYDEAALLGREALTPWSIRMVKALSIVGFQNRFFMFNFPDFWALDPYIRDHRCRTRVFVQSFRGIRGFATFYSRIKKPFKDSKGRSVWWSPSFSHRFFSFDMWDDEYREFWDRYRELETREKRLILSQSHEDLDLKVIENMWEDYPISAIAKALGRSTATIHRKSKILNLPRRQRNERTTPRRSPR